MRFRFINKFLTLTICVYLLLGIASIVHSEKVEKAGAISKIEGTNNFYNTSRSNILFLERYKDLLDKGGKLLTVIDDTPLNGSSQAAKAYRKFIRKYFIIKARLLAMNLEQTQKPRKEGILKISRRLSNFTILRDSP